jgi:diguanylate cyclase (GGDEF)-like protein
VDYVTKEGRFSYEYALSVIHRLIKNQFTEVLVVDDSPTSRTFVGDLLRRQLYQVREADDGVHAIKMLLENPGIKLLIVDYNMPRMDGFELVKNLRVKYEKTDLVIIGISSEGESVLSAKFIKGGANDFLKKPFNHEEFYCRVSANIELVELVEQIRDAANRDELTGTYSRKYFFQQAQERYQEATFKASSLSLGVIELDNFSEINTSYGNEIGDKVIQIVSRRFVELFDRFILARAGGTKFYVLLPGLSNDKSAAFLEKVRQIVVSESIDIDEQSISVPFSAGVSSQQGENLDALVSNAEKCLLRAKEAGGDLVFGDD